MKHEYVLKTENVVSSIRHGVSASSWGGSCRTSEHVSSAGAVVGGHWPAGFGGPVTPLRENTRHHG